MQLCMWYACEMQSYVNQKQWQGYGFLPADSAEEYVAPIRHYFPALARSLAVLCSQVVKTTAKQEL